MPQVMDTETIAETRAGASGDEGGPPSVGHPHNAAAGHAEDEIVGALAVDRARQLDRDEPGNRDGPGLMRFGSAQDDAPADVGEGAADIDAAAVKVEVADPQGGGLAPAQAGIGQQQISRRQRPASAASART
jgi:hypothetical protein